MNIGEDTEKPNSVACLIADKATQAKGWAKFKEMASDQFICLKARPAFESWLVL